MRVHPCWSLLQLSCVDSTLGQDSGFLRVVYLYCFWGRGDGEVFDG